ncbi:unnamed protein product, partial [Linum perenne]
SINTPPLTLSLLINKLKYLPRSSFLLSPLFNFTPFLTMAFSNGGSDSSLIVSFGEMLIDFVPTVSGVSLAEAPGFIKAPGGAPANVAIAVARLGGKTAFVGKLGDDEFGRMLAGILKENGVICDGINFDKGARTALAFVTLKSDGDREFMFYRNPSADMLLLPEELNLELIRSIWDKAEIIKVSDVELEFLTGSDKIDDESAMSLWHDNLKLLLVTLGEKGCRYYTKSFHGSVDAFHVNAVDTTGAGDSFVGALLTKIVDDQSVLEEEARLRELLKFANACGAITTTKKGAIPALPTEADAIALMKSSSQ